MIARLLAVVAAGLLSTDSIAGERIAGQLPLGVSEDHPLGPPRDLVSRQLTRIRADVSGYSFRLIKRERIDGQLQRYQFIDAKVRRKVETDGQVVQPFAVFIQYLGPKRIAGRKVLFIAGENDDRMLVRQPGHFTGNVTLKIAPNSAAARRESLQPITDLGFEEMAVHLHDKLTEEMQADPRGENTRVEYLRKAKLDERICTCIRVTHLKPQSDLSFHVAEVFLDDELELPVRIASYDWPPPGSQELPLISEYIYTRLELNIGLTAADFDPAQLTDGR